MQLNHAALVGFDLREMEGDHSVELLEEWGSHHQSSSAGSNNERRPLARDEKAFGGDYAASNKPDDAERRPETPIHELREIA